MNAFRSMGCEVALPPGVPAGRVRALFDERDRRFSRFIESSELNRVNACPVGLTVVSEEFASMLSLALDAARATDGLVTPAVGGAIVAAGYDRDFSLLSPDGGPVEPAAVPSFASLVLGGVILLRCGAVDPRPERRRQGQDGRRRARAARTTAGSRPAAISRRPVPIVVGLPGGDAITLDGGGLATTSIANRAWLRGGERQHHLIDPRDRCVRADPWRDVTVAAPTCLAADVAAKAALLLGDEGPAWLDERGLAGRFVDARRAWC